MKPYVNIWEQIPLRYLGYSNEVGESFGLLSPWIITPSYVAVFLYILCDVFTGIWHQYHTKPILSTAIMYGIGLLLWQILASVVISGTCIHYVTQYADQLVNYISTHYHPLSSLEIRWIPICIGLLCIPLIIHPVDTIATWVMKQTYNRYALQITSPLIVGLSIIASIALCVSVFRWMTKPNTYKSASASSNTSQTKSKSKSKTTQPNNNNQ